MKIIRDNHIKSKEIKQTNVQKCHWCQSLVQVEEEDIKRGTIVYSQREIDNGVRGFDCPCCNQFTALK